MSKLHCRIIDLTNKYYTITIQKVFLMYELILEVHPILESHDLSNDARFWSFHPKINELIFSFPETIAKYKNSRDQSGLCMGKFIHETLFFSIAIMFMVHYIITEVSVLNVECSMSSPSSIAYTPSVTWFLSLLIPT